MSEENKELIAGTENTSLALPDWMREDSKMGREELSRFIIPPRLIIVQPLSNPPLDSYIPGTPVVMPNEEVISEFDAKELCLKNPFIIVPLFFFVEYTLDNPRELHATKGKVRDRTFDPDSVIARMAQSPKTWEVPCPDLPAKSMHYTTRLNFIIQIMDERFNTPVLVTFKRAEMKVGMAFNSLIQARNAPIFGGQYTADVGFRQNESGKWYGLNIYNPPKEVGGWVKSKELYDTFKDAHLKFAEAHEQKLILPDLEGEDAPGQAEPEM